MATKTLKTRIQNKIDYFQNWQDNNPTPLNGEICIVVVPAATGAVIQEPTILFKVGDGATPFKQLGFTGGIAADVYDWAKEATKPTYSATDITGIGDYIAQYVDETLGISVDTDTQYRITKVDDYNYKLQSKAKGEADTAYADVSTIVIPKYDDTEVKEDIAALETLVGTTAVSTQIANAIAALNLASTYEAKGEAAKVQTALDAYKTSNDAVIAAIKDGESIDSFKDVENALADKQAAGDYATKSEAQGYADAKDEAIAAAKQAGDDAQADVDALAEKVGTVADGKTVVQMIEDAKTAATYDDTQVKADIEANAEAIALLNDGSTVEGSVDYKIAQAVAAIMENPDDTMNSINELVTWCNDHAADALELSNKVSANETDIAAFEELVGSTAVATQITDAIASALKIDGVDKYALATDLTAAIARIAALEANTHTHNNKALLDTYDQTNANIKNAVDKAHEHSNKATLDKVTEDKLTAWDKVSEKANDADLASIAKTGNVNDLIQTDGDYIIFNCGSATEVI